MTKFNEMAEQIVSGVGGKNNIDSVQHCATRLRFKLKNNENANTSALKNISGTLDVIEAGGQLQVVIGPNVSEVYQEVLTKVGNETRTEGKEIITNQKAKTLDKIFSMFSEIFTPFVPVLAGCGVLRGLLTLVVSFGWLSNTGSTYTILWAIADTVLYFMPFYLAITSARYFKVNEFLGLSIAGVLLYPSILAAFTEGSSLSFLGIPVQLIKYASSVVPIIIAVYVLSVLDKFIRTRIPAMIRSFTVPFLDLIIMIPATLIAIGPIFTFFTNIITNSFLAIYDFSPVVLGLLFGALWQPLVVFGLHRGFIPINLNNLATLGREPLLPLSMPSQFAQAGAALGIAIRSKNKGLKAIAGSNILSGLLGITEPIVYGVTLKARKSF